MMGKVDLAAAILHLSIKATPQNILSERLGIAPKDLVVHLRTLESKNLISISKIDGKLKTTKRGTRFLDLYNSIHSKYLTVSA